MNDPVTVQVELPRLTPAHLAALFWAMDDAEQGLFFDELGTLVMTTPAFGQIGSMYPLDYQLYHASRKCTPLGRDAMSRFAESGYQILEPKWKENV